MSGFKPYPAYKNSGSNRLGNVPAHWEVVPCRAIVDECVEKNSLGKITEYLSLMANIGIIRYEDKGDVGNKKPDDLSKCKIVKKGDLVINSMNYGIGSYGLSPLDGICSPVYIVLDPRDDVIQERFALRIFEEKEFQAFAQSFGNGILAHRSAIGWDDLKNILVALPPLPEQTLLSNFLDHETARIDALIEEQQRLIELLKEKRQAVISHAVTKGLDPTVPMKDSGVEWLGEVPAHWTIVPVKHVAIVKGRIGFRGYTSDDMVAQDEGALVIGATEMTTTGEVELRAPQYISWEKYYESPEIMLKDGDLLVVQRGSTVGKVAYFSYCGKEATINPSLIVLKDLKVDSRFFLRSLQSDYIQSRFALQRTSTAIPMISQEQVENYRVALPPNDEQSEINFKLDESHHKLDALINETESLTDLLYERRSALISAAVTGKIDVRNWQPTASAQAPEAEQEAV